MEEWKRGKEKRWKRATFKGGTRQRRKKRKREKERKEEIGNRKETGFGLYHAMRMRAPPTYGSLAVNLTGVYLNLRSALACRVHCSV